MLQIATTKVYQEKDKENCHHKKALGSRSKLHRGTIQKTNQGRKKWDLDAVAVLSDKRVLYRSTDLELLSTLVKEE